jgi:deferrochelatase/peroxidase EfeB
MGPRHDPPASDDARQPVPISRRGFLGAAGGLVAGAAFAGAERELPREHPPSVGDDAKIATVPFYGIHQGGISTPPQRHSYFAALDVTTDERRQLVQVLQAWTEVAANLCSGRSAAPMTADAGSVEADSGEALGLGPARLTVNFGFGPSLFGLGAPDRFGLARNWPMPLIPLPNFPGDQLIASKTGGDLTIHACADDPQVAFHAVRQLVRTARRVATIRWAQAGFNEASAANGTPRNLLGFKDGTMNLTTDAEMDELVWAGGDGDQAWMQGGTYLVVRRIRVSLEQWDAQSLGTQERVIGRHKLSGAPLGKSGEFDRLDLDARDSNGRPVIPLDAHVRLASPQENWGQRMLRRSYAYNDGVDPFSARGSSGPPAQTLDAGLFFAAYQVDPRLSFIPIFQKLAESDALSRFTTHTGSAIAAIPPAAPHPGRWVGQQLLE